jgi:hypothetical protein
MWRRVDLVCPDVSKDRIASIFRVKNPRAKDQREQVAEPTSQKTAFFIATVLKTSDLT